MIILLRQKRQGNGLVKTLIWSCNTFLSCRLSVVQNLWLNMRGNLKSIEIIIFTALRLYEDTVNSFLEDKVIKDDECDDLKIEVFFGTTTWIGTSFLRAKSRF